MASGDDYLGTSAHHSSTLYGSDTLECTIYDVVSTSDIKAICHGVVAIGSSVLISTSEQNVAKNTSSYPITGGTGVFAHARGTVKTTAVGKTNNSNAVIAITG